MGVFFFPKRITRRRQKKKLINEKNIPTILVFTSILLQCKIGGLFFFWGGEGDFLQRVTMVTVFKCNNIFRRVVHENFRNLTNAVLGLLTDGKIHQTYSLDVNILKGLSQENTIGSFCIFLSHPRRGTEDILHPPKKLHRCG